eukprot:TRINITY_DN8117_c0_g1_i2.p1 TRINITY_DN8117_c0_g1~~TRINITY_DN8117_c0_g1_i2.p1  ORF type:complete len:452 (+),score=122.64 TRINITY_DN8117_c0_g1_i2:304-1659(+)
MRRKSGIQINEDEANKQTTEKPIEIHVVTPAPTTIVPPAPEATSTEPKKPEERKILRITEGLFGSNKPLVGGLFNNLAPKKEEPEAPKEEEKKKEVEAPQEKPAEIFPVPKPVEPAPSILTPSPAPKADANPFTSGTASNLSLASLIKRRETQEISVFNNSSQAEKKEEAPASTAAPIKGLFGGITGGSTGTTSIFSGNATNDKKPGGLFGNMSSKSPMGTDDETRASLMARNDGGSSNLDVESTNNASGGGSGFSLFKQGTDTSTNKGLGLFGASNEAPAPKPTFGFLNPSGGESEMGQKSSNEGGSGLFAGISGGNKSMGGESSGPFGGGLFGNKQGSSNLFLPISGSSGGDGFGSKSNNLFGGGSSSGGALFGSSGSGHFGGGGSSGGSGLFGGNSGVSSGGPGLFDSGNNNSSGSGIFRGNSGGSGIFGGSSSVNRKGKQKERIGDK